MTGAPGDGTAAAAADDLDALAGGPPLRIAVGGRPVALPPLTLARYAAGRRFARAFAGCLGSDDILDAVEAARAALEEAFEAATGVDPAGFADAAEAIEAFFALVRMVRDFSGGPLAAALIRGLGTLGADRAAVPDGAPSSPGSSDADTPSAR